MTDLRLDSGIVALVLGFIGAMWAMVQAVFNVLKRVENNEKDIAALKIAHDEKLDDLHNKICEIGARTEKRHDSIEAKIDRLIDRSSLKQ
jgi:hypothetical protein